MNKIAKQGDTISWSFGSSVDIPDFLRDNTFEAKVSVVNNESKEYGVYAEYGQDFIPFSEATVVKVRKIVIVDIDGTVAKVGDRLKYLKSEKPDWDKFYASCFDDDPISEMVDLVKVLQEKYTIVFLTGRREQVRTITAEWLNKNEIFGHLLMRPDDNKRHDIEVKPEQFKKAGYEISDVAFVLEDRDSMVKKWRSLGLKCLQVDYGDF